MGMIALLFYFIYMLMVLAVPLATYVLKSAGLYTIAKRRGIRNPWLAWIPVGCAWIIGCISDQYRYVAKGQVKNKRKALLVLWIIFWALMIAFVVWFFVFMFQIVGMTGNQIFMPSYGYGAEIPQVMLSVLGFLLLWLALAGVSVAMIVIRYMALYDVFYSCEPNNATLYLVLGILFVITQPIFLFLCRDKDEGMPPRKTAQPEVTVEYPFDED